MDGEIIYLEAWKKEKKEQQHQELTALQEEIDELMSQAQSEESSDIIHIPEDHTMSTQLTPYYPTYGLTLDDSYNLDACPSCGRKYSEEDKGD